MSIDRCDLQFGTNACAKEMKQPTKASWTRLKRLARYLARTQSASCTHETLELITTHTKHSCESGQTVIGLVVPNTGKVNVV